MEMLGNSFKHLSKKTKKEVSVLVELFQSTEERENL